MATKRGSKRVYTKRLSPIQEESNSSKRGTKRKREDSSELRKREASNERRKRLSSQEAFQKLLNKWANSNKANKAKRNSKQNNIQLLKNELNKNNKNKTMNLLSNNGVKMKRKFTFKGLGKILGTKI
jgi:hypothetical protein